MIVCGANTFAIATLTVITTTVFTVATTAFLYSTWSIASDCGENHTECK